MTLTLNFLKLSYEILINFYLRNLIALMAREPLIIEMIPFFNFNNFELIFNIKTDYSSYFRLFSYKLSVHLLSKVYFPLQQTSKNLSREYRHESNTTLMHLSDGIM